MAREIVCNDIFFFDAINDKIYNSLFNEEDYTNVFYSKLKEKYMDRKNKIFFYEMIDNLCRDKTISPLYFIKCYENTYIIKKYNKNFTDMYNIALSSIN